MFEIARRNLLKNTAKSKTEYGVTFTVNSDGSVTVNGAVNDDTRSNVRLEMTMTLPSGKYIFSGTPKGNSGSTTYASAIFKADGSGTLGFDWYGNGVEFEITEETKVGIYLATVYRGYTANNLTFYPMIRYADNTDDTWQPYIDDTTPKSFNVIIGGASYPVERFDVVKNGVTTTVWVANTPFYWIQDGTVQDSHPTAYNVTSVNPSDTYYRNALTGFYMTGNASANSTFKGVTDSVDTQRNKYMEVVVASMKGASCKLTVLDTEITSAGTYTIDVSGVDTVAIALDITASAGGNEATANISSIRFYS